MNDKAINAVREVLTDLLAMCPLSHSMQSAARGIVNDSMTHIAQQLDRIAKLEELAAIGQREVDRIEAAKREEADKPTIEKAREHA